MNTFKSIFEGVPYRSKLLRRPATLRIFTPSRLISDESVYRFSSGKAEWRQVINPVPTLLINDI
jgi:hypothetical protein